MKYYLIAGEASGDLHGSNLMKGLYARDPGADIRFWGGALMNEVYQANQEGTGLVKDYREGAVMGYLEVFLKGFSLLRKLRFCKEDIAAWKPDVVILIDYPGFNFKVAKFAHNAGFTVYYYIAPKVWASREGRIKKLRAWVDRLYVVFPFEVPYFKAKGLPFTYAGNPLVDAIDASPALKETRQTFLSRTGLPDAPWVALLAGSRSMEIGQMMPTFMELADRLHAARPQMHFVVAAAPSRTMADYESYLGDRSFVHVVFGETYGALRWASAAVINSGTASLEAALIGTPQVVGYKMAALSALIMRMIIRVKYVSLGNLIVNRLAFKEFLQEDFTVDNLLAEVQRLLDDPIYRSCMQDDYAEIRRLLGDAHASEAVATDMVARLQAPRPK
jgi:lipid-A-disaccharide synthase